MLLQMFWLFEDGILLYVNFNCDLCLFSPIHFGEKSKIKYREKSNQNSVTTLQIFVFVFINHFSFLYSFILSTAGIGTLATLFSSIYRHRCCWVFLPIGLSIKTALLFSLLFHCLDLSSQQKLCSVYLQVCILECSLAYSVGIRFYKAALESELLLEQFSCPTNMYSIRSFGF